jgi:hypothetical protein
MAVERDDGEEDEGVTDVVSPPRVFPFVWQLVLQFAVALGVYGLVWLFCAPRGVEWKEWNGMAVCLATGLIAGLIARWARQPWWRQLIHFLFVPLLWGASQFAVSPLWHLAAFALLLLMFRGAASGQIPLYLSGKAAARRLLPLLPDAAAVLDVGAGFASLLLPLARLRPDLRLSGIENAPLPWLIGWLRARGGGICGNGIDWRWGDFWRHSLSPYQAVYCFLSPAPMPELWRKACREMRPGSLFVSNAFPVPGVEADMLRDAENGLTLYIYRIPAGNSP